MGISTFLGVETALRGILAQQRAIDTAGHNIANASTVGYSRQRADFATTTPMDDTPSGLLGTGVDVVQYQRLRDSFIDIQLRAQTMRKGSAQAQQDGLNQVELSLNEPSDTGVSSLLSKYWASWQSLANAPESLATRQALVQSAASLANGLNTLASQFSTVLAQTTQQQGITLAQVNSIGTQIASLTGAIKSAQLAGAQPNDLLDKRDVLIDQLSELGNVSVSTTAGSPGTLGAIDVSIGGTLLVSDTTASTLALPLASLTSGKLAGLQSVLTTIGTASTGYIGKLNQLAAALAAKTNTQHALGTDLAGATGGAFFTVTAGNEAATIAVAPALLASPSLIAASLNGQAGNSGNALAIADLQGTAVIGGATIDTAYSQLVTQIGSDSQQAQQSLSNASSLVDALTNRRQSVSGVSLDEEMATLVRYQRGFQASARALSAMDEMIDQLVNRTGRVGL
ncbi:MAG: flgK [Actinomycetia bacterium]|nr:flgK [Actinomycetes bacterium]